jgi:hypothetical protein
MGVNTKAVASLERRQLHRAQTKDKAGARALFPGKFNRFESAPGKETRPICDNADKHQSQEKSSTLALAARTCQSVREMIPTISIATAPEQRSGFIKGMGRHITNVMAGIKMANASITGSL